MQISEKSIALFSDRTLGLFLVIKTENIVLPKRIEDIQETDGAVYQCQVIIALAPPDKEQADVPLIGKSKF